MRIWTFLAIAAVALGINGCSRRDDDSAAREAGRTAHKIATKTEEVAKKAGRKLEQAGREAREGWKEAEREDQSKSK